MTNFFTFNPAQIKPKYLVCVEEYSSETPPEEVVTIHNSFLSSVASRPRNSFPNYYDLYGYGIPQSNSFVPKFTVGGIYTLFADCYMIDDNNKFVYDIDETKFAELEFNISEEIEAKIERFKSHGIYIDIQPYRISFDKDEYERTKTLSNFTMWFKLNMFASFRSVDISDIYHDEDSISNAIYNVWKKVRQYSPQVQKICSAFPSIKNKVGYLHYNWPLTSYYERI